MNGKDVLSGVVEESFSKRENAERSMEVLGIDAQQLRSQAPQNDEVPPVGVTNLTATPIYAGIRLNWDLPPAEDIVRYAVVEITPDGEASYEYTETGGVDTATIFNLEAVDTTFRVKLVDEWGLESPWSGPIIAKPITTADADIDLAYKQAQGTLQGLIEAVNIAGASAAEGIRGVSLAATQANNMLPLIESDLEMWNNNVVWPPPAAKLADGTILIDSDEPVGHALDMTRHEGSWKIRHVRETPSTNYVVPVTPWREERRVASGQAYIAQATVSGPAGAVVSIAIENAEDATGTNLTTANEEQFTLGGGTVKIYASMLANPSKPYVRIRLGLHTDNTTVYWYKFMLEHARANATEPSPWNAGILAVGSVAAHTLTAISANIAQAVFEEAAIQSAMINSLKADKIEAGEIHTNILIAEGAITGAGATLDNRGLFLKSQETNPDGNQGANGFPGPGSIGDWLTSNPESGADPKPHSGIGFFDDHNDPRRGILIRARGVAGNTGAGKREGHIALGVTSGGTNLGDNTSASIVLRSATGGNGTIALDGHVRIRGGLELNNGTINSDEISALDVKKLTAGGEGNKVDKDLLPNIGNLNGQLAYGQLSDKPDLSKFVTGDELANKGYKDADGVRAIVRDMVKTEALK